MDRKQGREESCCNSFWKMQTPHFAESNAGVAPRLRIHGAIANFWPAEVGAGGGGRWRLFCLFLNRSWKTAFLATQSMQRGLLKCNPPPPEHADVLQNDSACRPVQPYPIKHSKV